MIDKKICETLRENIKFLQMELQIKNDVIKNLSDTQTGVVESLSHSKDKKNQLTSLEKQQVTIQPSKVSNQYQNNKHQITNKTINTKTTGKTIIIKANTKLMMILANKFRSKISKKKQVSKKLYVGNLNKDITEEDLNQLFGLKTTVYFHQTCSIKIPLEKNTGKSKGFVFLKVPQHVYNELVKLNSIEFQNHLMETEKARPAKQTRRTFRQTQ